MDAFKSEVKRDEHGRLLPGHGLLSPGRPVGSISIKDKIREYLQEHPEAVTQVVGHFVHKNRELMWQMLEGSPNAKTDITSAGEKLPTQVIVYGETDPLRQQLNGQNTI